MTVADSSPLIALSAIARLQLLNQLYGTVHIPQAVWREVVVEGAGRAGAKEVAEASWIRRRAVKERSTVKRLMATTKLRAGESEAIVLAVELKALLLVDERPARRAAMAKQLKVIGTLGVLLQAKARNLVPSVKPLMDALVLAGLRVSPNVYRAVLRSAGE